MKLVLENWRKFVNEGFAGSKFQGGLPPELIDRYNEVEGRLDAMGHDGSDESRALEREYSAIEKKLNDLGYEIIMGGHIARIDNGKIVSKRSRFGEMRDRYLPPGEDPSDPTPQEEQEWDETYTSVMNLLDSAEESPGVLKKIDASMYIMYDTGGQQFLVFRKEDAEVYYKDKSDHLADEITDRIVNANRQKKSIRDYEGDH